MPDANTPPEKPDYTRPMAFALFGFGGSAAGMGALLFRMVFLPGKGRALMAFDPSHPLARISGSLLAVGLALIFGGLWLIRTKQRRAPRGPLSFRDDPKAPGDR